MSRARDLGSLINSTAAGKNLVINGGFDIFQRTSNPGSGVLCGAGTYIFDRWAPHQFQSAIVSHTTISSGSAPSSRFALRIGSPSYSQDNGGSRMVIAQKIESATTYLLRGKQIVLSFWVRFSNSNFTSISNTTNSDYGNFAYSVSYNTATTDAQIGNTGQDVFNTYTEILNTNSSGSLPTSWTKMTLTSTVPTDANNILVRFGMNSLGSSTSAGQFWYEITDVQLELGTAATRFSLSGGDLAGELQKCQRYYQIVSNLNGVAVSSTELSIRSILPVPMRSAPSLSATGVLNAQADGFGYNAAQSSVSFLGNNSTNYSLYVSTNNFSSLTAGRTYAVAVPANNSNAIILSAEL